MPRVPLNNTETVRSPDRRQILKDLTFGVTPALLPEQQRALHDKAVDMALSGDGPLLKFFMERMLPRDRCVKVMLPRLECAGDAIDGLAAVMQAVAESKLSPSEGAILASIIQTFTRVADTAELQKRIDAIEDTIKEAASTLPHFAKATS